MHKTLKRRLNAWTEVIPPCQQEQIKWLHQNEHLLKITIIIFWLLKQTITNFNLFNLLTRSYTHLLPVLFSAIPWLNVSGHWCHSWNLWGTGKHLHSHSRNTHSRMVDMLRSWEHHKKKMGNNGRTNARGLCFIVYNIWCSQSNLNCMYGVSRTVCVVEWWKIILLPIF